MPANPFAENLSATINADTSGFESGMAGAMDTLGSFKGAVAGAGLAVGALSTKLLSDAVGAATSFEAAMVGVEKVTDPETAERMGDAVMDMASRMPIAQEELAGVAEQAGRLGVSSDDLESFTETAAKMGVATDLAAEDAADAFARISTLMKIPMEDSEALGSAINELSNNFGTSASEMTDAMTRAGGALQSLGVGKEEALGLTAAMNEVSPSARIAGTSLRTVSESLMDPRKVSDIAAALGMTEDEFKQMRDSDPGGTIRKLATAMDEGGETSEALRGVLGKQASTLQKLGSNMDTVEQATADASGQFENATSLQEEFDAASSTFNARIQTLQNRLRNIGISIGEQVLPYLSKLLDYVVQGLDWFEALNERTDGLAGTFALVGGAIGGFVAAAASLVSILGGASAILGAVGAGVAALTSPLAIAVGAIVALGLAWQQNVGGIRDATMGLVETVRSAFTLTGGQAEALSSAIDGAMSSIRATLSVVESAFRFLFQNFLTPLIRSFSALVATHAGDIIAEFVGLVQTVNSVIRPFGQWISQFWSKWGDEILTVTRAVFKYIELAIRQTLDLVLTIIKTTMALLQGDWQQAWTYIADFFERTLSRIVEFLQTDAVQSIVAAFRQIVARIKTAVRGVMNFLTGGGGGPGIFQRAINAVTSYLREDAIGDIKSAFHAIGSGIRTAVLVWLSVNGRIWNAIIGFIGSVVEYLKNDAWGDMKAAATFLFDAWKTALTTVVNAILPPDGIVAQAIGAVVTYFREDAVGDLRAAADVLFGAFQAALEAVVGAITPPGGIVSQLIDDIVAFFRGPAWDALSGAGEFLVDAIKAAFVGLWEGLIGESVIPEMIGDIASYFRNAGTRIVKGAADSLVGDVKKVFTDAVSGFKSAGKSLISSVASGIREKIGEVKQAASGVASAIRDKLPGSDAEEGPLSDLSDSAAALPETLAAEIEANLAPVDDSAAALAEEASPAVGATAGGGGPPAGGASFAINGDIHVHGDVDDPAALADDLLRHVEARW